MLCHSFISNSRYKYNKRGFLHLSIRDGEGSLFILVPTFANGRRGLSPGELMIDEDQILLLRETDRFDDFCSSGFLFYLLADILPEEVL